MHGLPLLLGLVASQADAPDLPGNRLVVRASAWRPAVDGRMRINAACGAQDCALPGSSLRFDNDLGLEGTDEVLRFSVDGVILRDRVFDGVAQFGLGASYWSHRWESRSTLDQDEVMDGTLFPAGRSVRSELDVTFGAIEGFSELLPAAGTLFSGRAFLGVRFVRSVLELEGPGVEEPDRLSTLVFGGGLRVEMHPLSFLTAGTELALYGGSGALYEGAVVAAVGPKLVRLELGYHLFYLSDDGVEESVRIFLQGPFAGLTLRF